MKKIMKLLKKVIVRTTVAFFSVLTVLIVSGLIYIQLAPQFGSAPTEEQMQSYVLTGHYKEGKFLNLEPFEINLDCHSIMAMLRKVFNPPEDLHPKQNIEVETIDVAENIEQAASVSWLGHSSFYIQLDGKHILTDPIFSNYASPHPWIGPSRYHKDMPINIQDLPFIDVIIISHDHYDHLDYASVKQLIEKTDKFLVPLGVGNHLRKWGVAQKNVIELDWWQTVQLDGQTYVMAPSQHMSGRRLNDQSSTLWGSWIIQGKNKNIFFSGDSGYGSHFKKIGEKYGPFDIALMECGQYDELWANVHLTPEQTVQAGMEVKAKLVLPIHWGAFTLANHSWTDPIVRVTKEAKKRALNLATPKIGETVWLSKPDYPKSRCWEKYL